MPRGGAQLAEEARVSCCAPGHIHRRVAWRARRGLLLVPGARDFESSVSPLFPSSITHQRRLLAPLQRRSMDLAPHLQSLLSQPGSGRHALSWMRPEAPLQPPWLWPCQLGPHHTPAQTLSGLILAPGLMATGLRMQESWPVCLPTPPQLQQVPCLLRLTCCGRLPGFCLASRIFHSLSLCEEHRPELIIVICGAFTTGQGQF